MTAGLCADPGVTQVSKTKQVPFDLLPKPAPGLKTVDANVKLLLALGDAPCARYADDQLKPLGGAVGCACCCTLPLHPPSQCSV